MILSVIILAAGQGTRMNSDIPKVFHKIGNHPMIFHVVDLSQKLKAKSTTLVISKKLDNLINGSLAFAEQLIFQINKK